MLGGAGRSEEVRLGTGRKHQKVALILFPLRGLDGASVQIDGGHFRHLHVNVSVALQDAAQAESDVGCRQRRRGDLVEQRLKLLVIIFVDQGDPNVRTLG